MTISKKLTSKGSITIPKQLREHLDIQPNMAIDFDVKGQTLVIRRHIKTCRFCGTWIDLITVHEMDMCRDCGKLLVEEVQRHGKYCSDQK